MLIVRHPVAHKPVVRTSKSVIPTALKAKLSKSHCHPVGAQVVSTALDGVPQFDNLEIWFSRFPKSTLVMSACYTFPSTGLSTPNWMVIPRYGSPRWDIKVYAVPKNVNFQVKTLLKQSGLPLIREWLTENRTETWLEKSHRFELHYDSTSDELTST